MKIKIDPDLCTGCEDCAQAMPSVFEMNADGLAEVKVDAIPSELEDDARKIVEECQGAAMEIEE